MSQVASAVQSAAWSTLVPASSVWFVAPRSREQERLLRQQLRAVPAETTVAVAAGRGLWVERRLRRSGLGPATRYTAVPSVECPVAVWSQQERPLHFARTSLAGPDPAAGSIRRPLHSVAGWLLRLPGGGTVLRFVLPAVFVSRPPRRS